MDWLAALPTLITAAIAVGAFAMSVSGYRAKANTTRVETLETFLREKIKSLEDKIEVLTKELATCNAIRDADALDRMALLQKLVLMQSVALGNSPTTK